MPSINRVRRNDFLILLVVLFAAALVRLGEPGTVEFKLDEAWLTRLARDFAAGGALPLTGMPSSVGVPNPPASVYVMALPFAVTSNPVAATMFVAALNVAGVGLLWLIAHRFLGRTVALVAGLAYALSPWAGHPAESVRGAFLIRAARLHSDEARRFRIALSRDPQPRIARSALLMIADDAVTESADLSDHLESGFAPCRAIAHGGLRRRERQRRAFGLGHRR